jgi:putative thioredoxin
VANSQWVVEVSAEQFQDQVIAQSQQRPVVVDFWAPWCGPCRSLGPKLEALAVERNGGFLLAKVNTDENPELAQAFQVSGIPAVFAIREGKLIDQFTGVIPNEELQAFIDRLIPSEEEKKVATAHELESQDPKAALKMYRDLLAGDPDNVAIRVGLARMLLMTPGNEGEAHTLLTGVSFDDFITEATRLRTILHLRETPHTDTDLDSARKKSASNPKDAGVQYELGAILASRGEYISALDALLAAAENDRNLGREKVRELMLKIFEVIGPRSPEADQYRKRLQLLLY